MTWKNVLQGRKLLLPTIVLVLGFSLSILAQIQLASVNQDGDIERLERAAERLENEVMRRFQVPVYGLRGAGGALKVANGLTRSDFHRYMATRDLKTEFFGVRGMGVINRVASRDLDAFLSETRAQGEPDFAVRQLQDSKPDSKQDAQYIITYIEPKESNKGSMGLDAGSEPNRRTAIEKAIASGEVTMTKPIALVQDEGHTPGFLIYLPSYTGDAAPQTREERVARVGPVFYAAVVANELLSGVAAVTDSSVDFELFYGHGDLQQSNLVYDADSHLWAATGQGKTQEYANRRHFLNRKIQIHGVPFTLSLNSMEGFGRDIDQRTPWFIFAAGMSISVLLAWAVWLMASGRQKAEELAKNLVGELETLSVVARRTSNAVVITDRDRRVTWVNEGFTRISGYTLDEIKGKRPGELLQTERTDKSELRRVRDTLAIGQSFRGELLNRHKNGDDYWVELEIKPLFTATGGLEGFMAIETDVTERRKTQNDLLASQKLLDQTGRVAGIGGWMLDLDAKSVVWTDQTCRIHEMPLGHRPSMKEALGYFALSARKSVRDAVNACVKSGKSWDLELPLVTAGSRAIWVRVMGHAETLGGRTTRVYGAIQDITERRELEQALRERNEVMASILDNLPCGLSVFNADLELVAHNQQYRQLLDFPPQMFEVAHPRFEDFIRFNAQRGEYGAGDVEQIVQDILERARHPSVPHRFERIRTSGIPIEVQGAPMPSGGFVTTYTDISERRNAQAALRQREQLMRLVIDSFPGPVAYWDTDSRCIMANRVFESWRGLSAQDMVGKTHREVMGDELYEKIAHLVPSVLGGTQEYVRLNTVIADGSTRDFDQILLPDGDASGVHGYITMTMDITDLLHIQKQLELRSDQAEQANVAKSQFLANMSHEIRTPMNAILGMLTLLQRTPLTTRQTDYVQKTEGAARALLGLINDILDFSKIDAGKLDLDPHPFRVDKLLRSLADILAANSKNPNVEVLFDMDPGLPRRLVADDMRLQQVLINLATNAVKFTQKGEVIVKVALLETHQDSVRLEFSVRDTGIGIAPENQDRIFSGFSQAEASTTRRFGGTGLGLAISKRLVELMGGQLTLESELGVGSRFYFQLTLATDPEAKEPAPQSVASPMQVVQRALVVDDNEAAREILARMGESLGWQMDVVDSGTAALDRLRSGTTYQAVFVDWQMPEMDGWDTSQHIRKLLSGTEVPLIIMVTAHGRDTLAERSAESGSVIDAFVLKPVTASMLFDAVMDAQGQMSDVSHRVAEASEANNTHTSVRLLGCSLLVVEDNPTNQQIVLELLQSEGATVRMAGNGAEAVALLKASSDAYDVVLMDLQMPVMDGYEATRIIRHEMKLTALPVVAMTANAMEADREACLANGMNDHVGKPFDLDHLVAVIQRLSRKSGPGVADAGAASAPAPVQIKQTVQKIPGLVFPESVQKMADDAGVDLAPAVARLGSQLERYARMFKNFMRDTSELLAQLRHQQDAQDWVGLSHNLHTVKGLTATMGLTSLSDRASQAEKIVRRLAPATGFAPLTPTGNDNELALAALKTLLDEMGVAMPLLAKFEGELQAHTGLPAQDLTASARQEISGATDRAALRDALLALEELLNNGDMDAMQAADQLFTTFGAAVGADMTALHDAVQGLDFPTAASWCRRLLWT